MGFGIFPIGIENLSFITDEKTGLFEDQ